MKFICGNFKMNGSIKKIDDYINSLNELSDKLLSNVCICVPFPMLGYVSGAKFNIGAQDCHYEGSGAFTGDTSPELLSEVGCNYVIIGHSERRRNSGETNDMIYKKALAADKYKITPIVCIGEDESQKDNRFGVLRDQLSLFIPKEYSDECISNLIVAYEPIWCIGTGETPDNSTINGTCEFISEYLIKILGKKCQVLYGGSVTPKNSKEILSNANVDGLLVGGASLDPTLFKQIIKNAAL